MKPKKSWFHNNDAFGGYPTNEELLDINFKSIVSDARGLVRGTLYPRSWNDISSTWFKDDDIPGKNKGRYRKASVDKLLTRKSYYKPVTVRKIRPARVKLTPEEKLARRIDRVKAKLSLDSIVQDIIRMGTKA